MDLTRDVFEYLDVPGRRTTAETIALVAVPGTVQDVQAALESLRAEGKVSRVIIKGRDGITRETWKRRR